MAKLKSKLTPSDVAAVADAMIKAGYVVKRSCAICADPEIRATISELYNATPYSAEVLARAVSDHFNVKITGALIRNHRARHGQT